MEISSPMNPFSNSWFTTFFQSLLTKVKSYRTASIAIVLLSSLQSGFCGEVWEYSPYKVKVWVSISPSLSLSAESEAEIHRKIAEYAEIHFGPTWVVSAESTPDALYGSVLYRLNELTVEQLLERELILVVGKSDEAKQAFLASSPAQPSKSSDKPKPPTTNISKAEKEAIADLEARSASLQSVRTLESAIERLQSIAISQLQFAGMQRDIQPYLDNPQWKSLKTLVKPFDGSTDQLMAQLLSGETIAAFVQKIDIEKFKKVARQLPTRLPWQPEALLRSNDKIFMASVDRVGDSIRIQVKELDSTVRRMSESVSQEIVFPSEIARCVAQLARDCFSPIARIEESDFKSAVLRVRASGLLTQVDHPVRIKPGDVLLPILRRDDSGGNPTVLQTIPFTFVAVTEEIDQISRLYGAVFSANRGALAAAKNRRTQRIGLKVSARNVGTDLKLGIQRDSKNVVPGAEVYIRTPGTEDLTMVGRTDWRGILPLSNSNLPMIQYDPPEASKTPSIANARQLSQSAVPAPTYMLIEPKDAPGSSAATATPSVDLKKDVAASKENNSQAEVSTEGEPKSESGETNTAEATATPPPAKPVDPPKYKGSIQLNIPLYLYYVKNGETLLARLPIVTGMKKMEQADLPDDRRRLETEAFLRGLQGEVLDIVVRRKILESRIKQKTKTGKREEAERLLDDLKRVKSYDKMAEQIEGIQRRALSTEQGMVSPGALKRIDKMLDTTRQMMQKYLQDTLVRDLESELNKTK
jgi:hypothetical protein